MHVDGLVELANDFAVNIIAITVENWDNALTPWPAKGVFPRDADFKGEAASTLRQIKNSIIPEAEKRLGFSDPGRWLAGISLSGLFAVWAWAQDDTFHDIASISGSFWYDGFTDWLSERKLDLGGRFAYLSLGDKEGLTHVARYKPVVEKTALVEQILRRNGAEVVFEQTEGTHFAPMLPRLRKALAQLAGH